MNLKLIIYLFLFAITTLAVDELECKEYILIGKV